MSMEVVTMAESVAQAAESAGGAQAWKSGEDGQRTQPAPVV